MEGGIFRSLNMFCICIIVMLFEYLMSTEKLEDKDVQKKSEGRGRKKKYCKLLR
jgi:hypothetical protein